MGNEKIGLGLKDFGRALFADWLAGMSGPISVPAAIAAVYVDNTAQKFLLGGTAFICLSVTAFSLWKTERSKVLRLEKAAREIDPQRDVGVSEAVGYVAFRQWNNEFFDAAKSADISGAKEYDEFLQAIADGEIPIWGKKTSSGVFEPVPNDYWFQNRLEWFSLLKGKPDTESSVAAFSGDKYSDLMTSRHAVERYWPVLGSSGLERFQI